MSLVKSLAFTMVAGACMLPSLASAEVYDVRFTPNNDRCYTVTYRQQVDRINTMGQLVRRPGYSFVAAYSKPAGGFARDAYSPAVYLETRRMIQPEHYSMARTGCIN